MTRRYLTDKEKAEMVLSQRGRCACCSGKLQAGNIEFDHTVAGWLVEHKDKPDRAICRRPCHLDKTRDDVKRIAKVKRLLKGKRLHSTMRNGRKLQSRGFSKEWTRRFDGSVVRRAKASAGDRSVASPQSLPTHRGEGHG